MLQVLVKSSIIQVALFYPFSSVYADDASTVVEAVEYVQRLCFDTKSWNLTSSRSELKPGKENPKITVYRCGRAGDSIYGSSTYQELGKQKTSVFLINPAYSGTVERFENGAWSLTALYLKSDPKYESHVNRSFIPVSDFKGIPYSWLLDEIKTGRISKRPGAANDDSSVSYDVVTGPETVTEKARPSFKDVVVNVTEIHGQRVISQLTARFDANVGDSVRQSKNIYDFANWVISDDLVMPSEITRTSANLDPENLDVVLGQSVTKNEFDLTHMEEPINEEECRLSFYGLPEPEGTQRSMLWPLIGVLASAVVVVVCVKVLRSK